MQNNADKDPEIDKIENIFKRIFQRGPIWLYKFVKKVFQLGIKVFRKVQAFRQKRKEARENPKSKDPKEKGILARAWRFLRQKYRTYQQNRADGREKLIDKESKDKGTLSKAWNFVKRKLVISRDHLTREQGTASMSHGRSSAEKPLLSRSNSAEKGGTPDGKPRLSAMTNRANSQAKLHNDALISQGLTRNPLAKGKGTPLPTR
ncbi:hypothetical protein QJ527_12385 [Enterococcus mundtii]|uniref:hypothetical protein n=1 Tax=Enterococcus TaxID=1350 RepID=UPI000F7D0535|nr:MULTISPECIES: hypothetical protein [Enterococcus]AZP93948.1 hypothetical protein CYK55_13235 [Enterococcus mundtii]MDK4212331.1 hypothetical protein [Enterococcus mundtii]MEC3942389.1 hypothetical protein [Enterococcus mundtii]